jgi:magnesium chelatase family protein
MFAAVTSVALVGVEPRPVRVEVHVSGSKPAFHLVGLPDTAVREAKERVRSAVLAAGFAFPNRRITVNLAPAKYQLDKPDPYSNASGCPFHRHPARP